MGDTAQTNGYSSCDKLRAQFNLKTFTAAQNKMYCSLACLAESQSTET